MTYSDPHRIPKHRRPKQAVNQLTVGAPLPGEHETRADELRCHDLTIFVVQVLLAALIGIILGLAVAYARSGFLPPINTETPGAHQQ